LNGSITRKIKKLNRAINLVSKETAILLFLRDSIYLSMQFLLLIISMYLHYL